MADDLCGKKGSSGGASVDANVLSILGRIAPVDGAFLEANAIPCQIQLAIGLNKGSYCDFVEHVDARSAVDAVGGVWKVAAHKGWRCTNGQSKVGRLGPVAALGLVDGIRDGRFGVGAGREALVRGGRGLRLRRDRKSVV